MRKVKNLGNRQVGAIELWQGCGKNPDFAAKADIIDNFISGRISNLRVCNASRKIRLTDPSEEVLQSISPWLKNAHARYVGVSIGAQFALVKDW